MVVQDGTIAGTGLPLVLISHGTAGSEASHYDTALALADAGFVVAALTHTGDNYMDQSYVGNRKNLMDRTAPGECCFELRAHNLGTARAVGRRAGGYVRVLVRWLHDLGGERRYSRPEPDARIVRDASHRTRMPLHKTTKWRPVKLGDLHARLDPRSASESSRRCCASSQLLVWTGVPESYRNSDPVVASLE